MQDNFSHLLSFYAGNTVDHKGRKIEEIWSWEHGRLEHIHDFIQWIFPLPEPSSFNPHAPVLTIEDMSIFRSNEELKDRLLRSLDLMLNFYGFLRVEEEGVDYIVKSPDFKSRTQEWVTPHNHNFLRITRILRSITLLGLSAYAAKFFDLLEELYLENPNIIGTVSFQYWEAAKKVT